MSMKAKIGGIVLTGLGAYLITSKALDVFRNTVKEASEASKWRAYYKCWSKGKYADGEPVAPGYSVSYRMDDGYVKIKDPTGVDHSKDDQKDENTEKRDKAIEAIIGAVKGVCEAVTGKSSSGSEEPRDASEGQTEASEEDISAKDEEEPKNDLENVIDGLFRAENTEMNGDSENDISEDDSTNQTEKETENDEHETVD